MFGKMDRTDRSTFRLLTCGAAGSALQQERDLIVAAQKGDTLAFKKLYERYRDRVYSLIYYNLNDAHLAEDVAQTVFVKAFQALPSFRMESGFLTWIYRVALNECKIHWLSASTGFVSM